MADKTYNLMCPQGHAHLPIGKDGEVVKVEAGQEFTTDKPLHLLYANKFVEVKPKVAASVHELTEAEQKEAVEMYLAEKKKRGMETFANEPTQEEREIALSGMPDNRSQVEKDQRTVHKEVAKAKELAPELPTDTDAGNGKKEEKKDDEEDMTKEFDVPEGVTVHKIHGKGHVVRQGGKDLTQKPLRSRPQVDNFLKSLNEPDEE